MPGGDVLVLGTTGLLAPPPLVFGAFKFIGDDEDVLAPGADGANAKFGPGMFCGSHGSATEKKRWKTENDIR